MKGLMFLLFVYQEQGFKSGVLSVSFHPSGRVIAAGGADYKLILFTSYIEDYDKAIQYKGMFEDVKSFGEPIFSILTTSWVEAVGWSPSGDEFAFTSTILRKCFIFFCRPLFNLDNMQNAKKIRILA